MNRIILHWTAGTNYASDFDRTFYHYLIDREGEIVFGKYSPIDNLDCTDGRYAKHCGGGNTGSIGIALCGMNGYKSSSHVGNYPLTKVQCERAFSLMAELCRKYNIPITQDTVMTHYEFGQKHKNTTSYGKIDIIYLPPYPHLSKDDIGRFIRSKVKWYYNKL